MRILFKNIFVEAYLFVPLIERYYGPVRRFYSIVTAEIPTVKPELAFINIF